MTEKLYSSITLHSLELSVYLGSLAAERVKKQIVSIDIKLEFLVPPKACKTDRLEDTRCYGKLIEKIEMQIAEKEFYLLEHLGQEIYSLLKQTLSDDIKISVRITKKPAIVSLKGGASFTLGDIAW